MAHLNVAPSKLARAISLPALLLFIGLFLGLFCVILPPVGALAIVGCAASLLLILSPDLQRTPIRLAKRSMPYFIFGTICLPIYAGVVIPGMPVLSFRRIAIYWLVTLTILAISVSSETRVKLWRNMDASPTIRFATLGYFALIVSSVVVSVSPGATVGSLLQIGLLWMIAFIWMVIWCDGPEQQVQFFRAFLLCAVVCALLGGVEFYTKSAFLWKLMPYYARSYFLQTTPALSLLENGSFRNGVYRAVSTFTTSLGWAQMTAMAMPFAAYFIVHGERRQDRYLGTLGLISCFIALFCSGSRGGYISAIAALCTFTITWAYRKNRYSRGSIVGGMSVAVCGMAVLAVVFSVFFVPAVRIKVFGGGATQSSDMGRELEWAAAKPKILSRPWGYGFNNATSVVNFRTSPESGATLDDYRINLLVDNGPVGLILYYLAILSSIFICLKRYVTEEAQYANPGVAIASSLLAYATYSTALSQSDNISLVFCLVGASVYDGRTIKPEDAREGQNSFVTAKRSTPPRTS